MNPSTDKQTTTTALHRRADILFGFVPALFHELLDSPSVANAYLSALEALSAGVLTDGERNVLMLAVSSANDSTYCMEIHRALARDEDVQAKDLDLITMQRLPSDLRLRSLVQTAWKLLDKHGQLSDSDIEELRRNGIERRQIYEVIAIIGIKTISNFIQHIGNSGIRGGNGRTK